MEKVQNNFLNTPVESKSMVDQVKERIINAIINGEIKPGEHLPTEAELCKNFGVSRNTIREVIKILVTNGVVYIKRSEGTFVSEGYNPKMLDPMVFGILLGQKDWKVLVDFRMAVDIGTLYLACNYKNEEGMAVITRALNKFEETLRQEHPSVHEIAEADNGFHLAIARMVGNEILVAMSEYIGKFTLPSRLKTTEENLCNGTIQHYYDLHKQIVELLEHRNVEGIEAVVKEHYVYWENTTI